jgi:hypothetical protein
LVAVAEVLQMAPELAGVHRLVVVVEVAGMPKVRVVQELQDKAMQAVQQVHLLHMVEVEVAQEEQVAMLLVDLGDSVV